MHPDDLVRLDEYVIKDPRSVEIFLEMLEPRVASQRNDRVAELYRWLCEAYVSLDQTEE